MSAKRAKAVLLAGLVVASTLMTGVVPASGEAGVFGGRSTVCTRSHEEGDVWCGLEIQGFPGGTLHVDVDVSGQGQELREWNVQANWREVCRQGYSGIDPARSWTCTGVPAGHLHLMASKPPWEEAEIGLRW